MFMAATITETQSLFKTDQYVISLYNIDIVKQARNENNKTQPGVIFLMNTPILRTVIELMFKNT